VKVFFSGYLVNVVRRRAHAQAELSYRFCDEREAEVGNGLPDAEIAKWEGTEAFLRGFLVEGSGKMKSKKK